ncbi:VanZ family protein [Petrachloros mirabilis]
MKEAAIRPLGNPDYRWVAYWLPAVAYAGVIYYFSSLPHPEEKLPKLLLEAFGDKSLHMAEYAVLSVLFYRAFRWAAGARVARHALVLAIAVASFYGLTDEVHQAFVPNRESSLFDWLADTVGAAIGAIGACYLGRNAEMMDQLTDYQKTSS